MAFLILVIGDLHIPDRALDIPPKVSPPMFQPPFPLPKANFRHKLINPE